MNSYLPDPASAIRLSVEAGLGCALFGLPIAVALGWLLARHRFRGKQLISTLILAPMVLPPVVTGVLLLKLFGTHSWLGTLLAKAGIEIPFSFIGVLIAALVVSLPLYVISVRGAFEAIDPRCEELARTLGHTPLQSFWKVSLPLALPGILAGALLSFARALGEFGATAVLAGNIEGKTRTLSLAVYTLMDSPDGDHATQTLLGVSLALTFLALLGGEWFRRWQRARMGVDHASA